MWRKKIWIIIFLVSKKRTECLILLLYVDEKSHDILLLRIINQLIWFNLMLSMKICWLERDSISGCRLVPIVNHSEINCICTARMRTLNFQLRKFSCAFMVPFSAVLVQCVEFTIKHTCSKDVPRGTHVPLPEILYLTLYLSGNLRKNLI